MMQVSLKENNENSFYGLFVVISSGIPLYYSFLESELKVGQFVYLPLRQGKTDKIVVGVLLNFCKKPDFECRSIQSIFPYSIALKKEQLDILNRAASYYLTPLEWCVRLLAPSFLWQIPKLSNFFKYFEKHVSSRHDAQSRDDIIKLNAKQQIVFEFILKNINQTILLHGVTGSGKTEIYLAIAQHIIGLGKNCLILVPEISLTPQMESRFRSIFKENLNVLHSGLSQVSFMKEWISIYLGESRVVLGVRSAVFCPLENIGLIIVDEEHDQSYKCTERPCYHARDVAVMRAKLEGACSLLGSATPSLESFLNTKINKYKYIELSDKYSASTEVTNFIFEPPSSQNFKLNDIQQLQIAPEILDLIGKNQAANFQTLVLINRRGFVNYALCDSCRTPLTCPNCSVATTIHNFGKREICHYCGFNQQIRTICPACKNNHFLLKGFGTQNVEAFLQKEIPNLRLDRLDRDSLTSHSKLTKLLNSFAKGEINCLVGTQMLAKGHDFEKITLIVILNLEDGLFLPDFRAAEKTFHLLTQAMGRVGRGKYPGIVAIQSMIKSHPIVEIALKNEPKLFLERELHNRKRAYLPPYSRFILFEIRHKQKILAEKYGQMIKNACLDFWIQNNYDKSSVFLSGPFGAPIEKINHMYRLHICVHISKNLHPKHCIPESIYTSSNYKNFLKIDVDPQNFM